MGNLSKEIAVITGGTGAIGASFAEALCNAGAKVVILGRGKTKPVSEAAKEIEAKTGLKDVLFGYQCDASDEAQMAATIESIRKEVGMPTLLVNAAGGNKGKAPFTEVDVDIFDEVVKMNLLGGLVIPTKHMARIWIAEGIKGNIINIASMASYLPLSGVWAYAASKAGVMNLTAGLAKEFASAGIRVNGIAPGFFVGNQNRDLLYDDFEKDILSARGKQIIGHTPFGRFGDISELNGTLVYLADRNASGFVTGVTIPVDGGYLIDNI
ncbi:SDR family NAD(P)-dependent oxidoreductase [Spirochaeta isovalerica]|uniref:NAD(P)-dependent dehydrogenase (Short-subunit alcohol dehydrogenase family) n=1 Tax=Spirochaeta isovalerica TaxID=150 RepID=A0A841R8H3_9SPIO|nr:SDR family NAD(P)-dependent oxidoreductase [Spirochaeta isovalerica]MBB6479330.1 NAD(P)-dependent dehydrogenase (short-subunit alcohol dehydrogenase family) [Spirochaeta isovalerica]